jgi:hypothetical protein
MRFWFWEMWIIDNTFSAFFDLPYTLPGDIKLRCDVFEGRHDFGQESRSKECNFCCACVLLLGNDLTGCADEVLACLTYGGPLDQGF